ncbi:MAG: alkaline phosphatase D family protein [Vibrio sp.]
MTHTLSRRRFLTLSAKGFGAAVVSYGLMGCKHDTNTSIPATFEHGIASGDPSTDSVILWTRVTPQSEGNVTVAWEVALDSQFTQLITSGDTVTNAKRDYTVKVDAIGLDSGTLYYYRFMTNEQTSRVGQTKTLPKGHVESVRLAVVSCSNYPAGFFNVYALAAQRDDLDALLHLGDYIYEYGRGGYASENAQQMDREVLPASELLSLSDYRTRYAQYHTDPNLQDIHAKVPFIAIWDDHEVANDTWKNGAENHNEGEGDFDARKDAATQAYFEWLPIRPWSEGNHEDIYRSFKFGDLLDLHMLDTRLLARDKQFSYTDFIDGTGQLDIDALSAAINDENRTILGQTQLAWLQNQLQTSTGRWQVIGQQILMGRMLLPAAIATSQLSISDYAKFAALAVLVQRVDNNDPSLTQQEKDYVASSRDTLTDNVMRQLQLPSIPYNLDAWDGYGHDRDVILNTISELGCNAIVLAGDTHNAWANNLADADGNPVAVELATSSVSSPGMEQYLGFAPVDAPTYEQAVINLVDGLEYTNMRDRGYLLLNVTPTRADATWYFVDTITTTTFNEFTSRRAAAHIELNQPTLIVEKR